MHGVARFRTPLFEEERREFTGRKKEFGRREGSKKEFTRSTGKVAAVLKLSAGKNRDTTTDRDSFSLLSLELEVCVVRTRELFCLCR